MKKKIAGIAFVLLSIAIMSVSAFVYEQAQQTIGQTIVNVATITLKNSVLGNLDEGETRSYTKAQVTELGAAITVNPTKAVYMHLNSNIDALSSYYTVYTLTVRCFSAPGGSGISAGDVVATLTLAAADSTSISLGTAGSYVFDFELQTTAAALPQGVASQATTATIIVSAEDA